MPIKRSQFDEGVDDTQLTILQYLREHSDQAFTLADLALSLGYSVGDTSPSQEVDLRSLIIRGISQGTTNYALSSALDSLAKKGEVLAKRIRGAYYYTIRQ
ncbi:MAG: hypothetical protein M1401_09355 [Chloroflexi bacterium]|nr:hypothetical protein [Chloroflexota bacterium]MCL5109052.1 hypothetical protein [Chloroflexota bacterium]